MCETVNIKQMTINSLFKLNIVMNLFQLDIRIRNEVTIKISLWKKNSLITEYL